MLVQETSVISMSPCTNDTFEENDIEPDSQELLDFLTHLVDEDALDLFQAPGHPCSAPIADFSCTRHVRKLQEHRNDGEHVIPSSTQPGFGTSFQEAVTHINHPRPFIPTTAPKSPGNTQSPAQGTDGSECSPPEGMMAALLDMEGTLNAPVPSALPDDPHQACVFQSDALPEAEADNSGSTAHEPPKETKQERSARLKREKNRRNQKAFRERCRVQIQDLTEKIKAIKAALHQQLSNRRRLQCEKAALMHSLVDDICSTSPRLDVVTNRSGSAEESAAGSFPGVYRGPPMFTSGDACSHDLHSACVAAFHTGVQDIVQHTNQHKGARTYGASNGSPSATPAPISSFEQCAALSYRLLEKHLLPRRLWKSNPHGYIAQAYSHYMTEVSEMTGVASDRTCWFLQTDFEVAQGVPVSYSAGFHSPECSLSATLVYAAVSLQNVLLLAEHEYLQSVSATSTNPCDTPESEVLSSCPHMPDALNSVDGPLPQPEQPDPHLLQRLRVRVGVNSSWPLADAVKKVFDPMVQECKATLPPHRWKHVAQLVTNALSANLLAFKQQARSKRNSRPSADTSDSAKCTDMGLGWGELDQAMLALQQHMLCTTLSAIWEGEVQPQGASLESVERRMFTHVGSTGVCKYACVVADRLRLRRMMETRVMRKQYNMVQAQRIHSRLYKFMALNRHQRDSLAARWHAWRRRRHNMDQPFLTAALDLQNMLEASKPLVECASRVAEVVAGPGDLQAVPELESVRNHTHAEESHVHQLSGSIGLLEPPGSTNGMGLDETNAPSTQEHGSEVLNTHAMEEDDDQNSSESETEPAPVMLLVVDSRLPSELNAYRIGSHRELHASPRSSHAESAVLASASAGSAAHEQGASSHGACIHECRAPSAQLEAMVDTAGGAPQMLGQCGVRVGVAQAAVQALLHVHHTDDLMQLELLTPLWELTPVQQARMFASHMTLGVSYLEVLQICHMAAGEQRREEVFSMATDRGWL